MPRTVVALLMGLAVSTPACERTAIRPAEAVIDANTALVRRWMEEGFNRHNLAVVDLLFADQLSINGQPVGRDGLKASMTRHLTSFPDLHVTINDIIAGGNKVGVWYTAEGTHRGEFEGIPPTGNHVKWSGFDLLTVEDGKFREARFISDFMSLMTQLGAKLQPPDRAPR